MIKNHIFHHIHMVTSTNRKKQQKSGWDCQNRCYQLYFSVNGRCLIRVSPQVPKKRFKLTQNDPKTPFYPHPHDNPPKMKKIIKCIAGVVAFDFMNITSILNGHIGLNWPLWYPKNDQKKPKRNKNHIFHHMPKIEKEYLKSGWD